MGFTAVSRLSQNEIIFLLLGVPGGRGLTNFVSENIDTCSNTMIVQGRWSSGILATFVVYTCNTCIHWVMYNVNTIARVPRLPRVLNTTRMEPQRQKRTETA